MKKINYKSAVILSVLLVVISLTSNAQQKESNPANIISNGTLLSSTTGIIGQFDKSTKPYDEYIIGVFYLGKNAVHTATRATYPVVSTGISYIKCNSENGKIRKGDLITSSSTPGEGMRATKSGMVIGIALEDYTDANSLVKVRLLIQYVKQ